MQSKTAALFSPGKVLISTPAIDASERNRRKPREFLGRHVRGDWGWKQPGVNSADGWCMSKYKLRDRGELWIITADDHLTTVIMVPGQMDRDGNFNGETQPLEEYESELQSR
jgi:hypothetical protein